MRASGGTQRAKTARILVQHSSDEMAIIVIQSPSTSGRFERERQGGEEFHHFLFYSLTTGTITSWLVPETGTGNRSMCHRLYPVPVNQTMARMMSKMIEN